MTRIYKFAPKALWDEAVARGEFTGAPVDLADGYIHFSTAEQTRETAAKHFAGQSDLVLAVIEAERLGDKLKWEPSRGGALFPHLYRTLAMDEVLSVCALPLKEDGQHDFGDLLV